MPGIAFLHPLFLSATDTVSVNVPNEPGMIYVINVSPVELRCMGI